MRKAVGLCGFNDWCSCVECPVQPTLHRMDGRLHNRVFTPFAFTHRMYAQTQPAKVQAVSTALSASVA